MEYSNNGTAFQRIAVVASANSSGTHQYSFVHPSSSGSLHFYRIKQVDADGKFEYSTIVHFRKQQSTKIVLQPNPASHTIELKNADLATLRQILIVTMSGKILQKFNPDNMLRYNVSTLASGMYFLRLIKKDETIESIPFIKQ